MFFYVLLFNTMYFVIIFFLSTKTGQGLGWTYVISHTVCLHSYNAIKGYTKEGRQTELSATEHLVSAAEAG